MGQKDTKGEGWGRLSNNKMKKRKKKKEKDSKEARQQVQSMHTMIWLKTSGIPQYWGGIIENLQLKCIKVLGCHVSEERGGEAPWETLSINYYPSEKTTTKKIVKY